MMKLKIWKKVILIFMVVILIGTIAACATDKPDAQVNQPWLKYKKYKYDDKLGGDIQIVDYKITTKPNDGIAQIELYFVSNFEQWHDDDTIFIGASCFTVGDDEDKDLYYDGQWYYADFLGPGIMDAQALGFSYMRLQESFTNKVEVDKNYKDFFEESFLNAFRIGVREVEENNYIGYTFYFGFNEPMASPDGKMEYYPVKAYETIDNKLVLTIYETPEVDPKAKWDNPFN